MAVTDNERTYRAVNLRKDEAEQLARSVANDLRSCCPHLNTFHQRWKTGDGRECRTCTVTGCGCYDEEWPDQQAVRHRELVAARERSVQRLMMAASAIGGALGILLAQWVWRLL